MAFRKRKVSAEIVKAHKRLDGMTQIDTDQGAVINYGTIAVPLTKTEMAAAIKASELLVSKYNQLLDAADAVSNDIEAQDDTVRKLNVQVLKGGITQFGEDANELEQLGGVRKSERKHPKRKPKTP